MRETLRAKANQLFAAYPGIGRWGYDLLRKSGIDRSTQGTKAFLEKLAEHGFAPETIADIGANYGGWSRVAAPVFPAAGFLLIEPQHEMKPFLDDFCAQHPAAQWVLAGAGAASGQEMLTVWDDLQGSAFLTPEIQAMTPYRKERAVSIVTLDQLVAEGVIPIPDLIKIDVQGFELAVLQGAQTCLGQTDCFIIETSLFHPLHERPTFYAVLERMEAHHYHVYDLVGPKYRSASGALAQIDICLVREGSVLRPAA
jgi:FkbM family methyltransferase